jgi:hypothetical protein
MRSVRKYRRGLWNESICVAFPDGASGTNFLKQRFSATEPDDRPRPTSVL